MSSSIPLPMLTDSYKLSHPFLYPEAQKMVAYAEFRSSYENDPTDHRILFYGLQYILDTHIAKQWTKEDVNKAELFFKTHNAGYTPFPFPRALFDRIIQDHNGWFPVKIEALPEGSACYAHTPVFQLTAEGDFSCLVTYLETLLVMVWYPCTVATLSRRARDVIESAFEQSVDPDMYSLLESRLHDFGFRGCTSVEQSIIGGSAHLVNFTGSDTLSAAYHVQYALNEGRPVATSIPATEHSVMTAHHTELDAIRKEIAVFGEGVYACVMDSYDYQRALENLLPEVREEKERRGGFWVLRPDSGDPVEVVVMALKAAEKTFGVDINKKGYKVLRGVGVIQGDGINLVSIGKILKAVMDAGFSAANVAFGMGGALLQKVHRDTMNFATKLSKIVYKDGEERDVMKTPKGDSMKISMPGELAVFRDAQGFPCVWPKKQGDEGHPDNMLQVVYDHGKMLPRDAFDVVRARAAREWTLLSTDKTRNVISQELNNKIHQVKERIQNHINGE